MLRTRIYLGLIPLLLILAGVGCYATYACRQLAESLLADLVGHYRDSVACQRMRDAATRMSNAVASPSRADVLAARREFDAQRGVFSRELMAQAGVAAGTRRAPLLATLGDAFQQFSDVGDQIMRDGGSGSLEAFRRNEAASYRLLSAVENLVNRDFAAAQEAASEAARLAATTTRILLLVIAGAIILALGLAWRLADAVVQPIRVLSASAVALGDGDWERNVPESPIREFGQLARVFNQMAAKLRAYREATTEKVQRTQRMVDATLTSAPDPVFVVDRDGTHLVRNPAAEQLAQLPDFHVGLPAGLAEPLAHVFATGDHYVPSDFGRVVTLRLDHGERHYLPRILAIGDSLAEFKGAAVILQDVTKFRLLDDAKTNLVGTVSHELKTPLTGLRMAVYLLLEQNLPLSPTQRELLETARDDSDRLLRILDNLLDLARLEAGASSLDRCSMAVVGLIQDVAAEVRPTIELAGQRLVTSVDPALGEAMLKVDANRLRHVFINLLNNASKYSPSGGLIMLSAAPEQPGFVRFGVSDEGCGIPLGEVSRVFERFYRASGQTKSGAGLGLAIAREIVVAHGGTINCISRPGAGSEFFFVLPR